MKTTEKIQNLYMKAAEKVRNLYIKAAEKVQNLYMTATEKVQNLYMNAAEKVLKAEAKVCTNMKGDKKKWFDNECRKAKSEIPKAGRDEYNDPADNLLRTKYNEKLREYVSICKSKQHQFWQNTFNIHENSLPNSKKYFGKI